MLPVANLRPLSHHSTLSGPDCYHGPAYIGSTEEGPAMRTRLEQGVLETIRNASMMVPGDRVGVAVSGGADSVALLHLLERLSNALGITLLVAHFNHSLRGAESEVDAQFVREMARAHNLKLIRGRADVAAAAAQHRWNLEDAARRLR